MPVERIGERQHGEAPATGTIARGSSLLFSAQLVGNSGLFVALLLIARSLGPTGRGTLAFITVTAVVLGKMCKVGMPQATTVFAAQRPASRAALLSNLVLVEVVGAVCLAGLVCGALALLPEVRPEGLGSAELVILGLATLAFALVEEAPLLGSGRFRQVAISAASTGWIYASLIALLKVSSQLTVAHAALAWVLVQVVNALLLISLALPGVGVSRPKLPLLRESIRFGLRAWPGTLSAFLNARVDQVIMGLIATEAALGIYAVAVNGSELLLYFPTAIATALLPSVAGGDPGLRIERTLRAFRSVIVVTAASVVVGCVVGSILIPVVYGEAFRPSIGPFLWLMPGALGYAASSLFSNALVASESPGTASFGPVAALVCGIALDLALIPPLGATGAAIAATAAFAVGGIVAIVLYHARMQFGWSALLPRRADVETLRTTAGLLLHQRRGSRSQAA